MIQAYDIFSDEAVIIQYRSEHFAKLPQNQYGKDTGQEEDYAKGIIILRKICIVMTVKFNTEWKRYNYHNSHVKHKV